MRCTRLRLGKVAFRRRLSARSSVGLTAVIRQFRSSANQRLEQSDIIAAEDTWHRCTYRLIQFVRCSKPKIFKRQFVFTRLTWVLRSCPVTQERSLPGAHSSAGVSP